MNCWKVSRNVLILSMYYQFEHVTATQVKLLTKWNCLQTEDHHSSHNLMSVGYWVQAESTHFLSFWLFEEDLMFRKLILKCVGFQWAYRGWCWSFLSRGSVTCGQVLRPGLSFSWGSPICKDITAARYS